MTYIDIIGLIAAVTSAIGLIPQLIKTHQTKSATDISTLMLYNYLVCSVSWTVYGALTHEKFVFASNVLAIVASLIMLWQKRRYSHPLRDGEFLNEF